MLIRNPFMTTVIFLAIIAGLNLVLLISGYRILIGEEEWEKYSEYDKFTESYLIDSGLECRYYTGRSIKTLRASWSELRIDECPFLFNPYQ